MARCPKCGTRYPSTVRICAHDGTVLNDEPANDPNVGKLLDGKYRLDSYLSHGGMGSVYKATHVMLDKIVVVKLIKPELVTSAEIVRRFQREARAASNLSHPNIVAVYDLGQTEDGTLYIAMEFIDGPSLKDVIRKTGPLPVARINTILRQVAAALAEAHGHHIIHRDLKPHNVMLAKGPGGQEVAKLLDFGIAKTFEEGTQLTQTGFAIGTPQYMAPEQAAGKEVTAQSDLYSLGAMLYEMLIGEVPFDASTTAAILIKQLTEEPQPPSRRKPELKVSPVLEAIAMRCLDKDPAKRFASAEAFAAALTQADAGTAAARSADAPTKVFANPLPPAAMEGGSTRTVVPPAPTAAVPQPTLSPATAPVAPSAPKPAPTLPAPLPPMPAAAAAVDAQPVAPVLVASPLPVAVESSSDGTGTRPTVPGTALPAAPAPAAGSSRTGLWITLGAVAVLILAVVALQLGVIPSGQGTESTASTRAQAAPAPQASPAAADTPAPAARTPAASPNAEAPPTSAPVSGSTAGSGSTPASGSALASANTAPASASAAKPAPPAASAPVASVPAVSPAVAPTPPSASTPPTRSTAPPPAASARPTVPAAAPAAAPAPAAAARPEHPAVFFQCAGDQSVCGTLRSTMLASLEKGNMPFARDPARAHVLLSASVEVMQDRANRDFGTTFATRTYSVEVSGETKDGKPISMPAPKTFSFDAQFGRERLDENARVIVSDVVDKVRAYWNK